VRKSREKKGKNYGGETMRGTEKQEGKGEVVGVREREGKADESVTKWSSLGRPGQQKHGMEREHGREENVNVKWNGEHGGEVKGK
jgi:hypothetical protein